MTLAGQGLKFVLSTGSTIVLARLLTPEDFGLVGMVTAVTGFIALFKDLGLSTATVQRNDISEEQVTALFWINVVVSALLVGVTAALAPLIAAFYGEERLTEITVALGIGFLFGGLTVQHQALLSRQMRFGALVSVDLAAQAVGVVAAIGVALTGGGVWALVVMSLVTSLSGCVGVWVMCGWRPTWPRRSANVAALLGFGGNLTGFNVVNYFARNLDNVLIGRVWGPQQLGLYGRAYQLLLAPIRQVNQPLSRVAIPLLSRLAERPEAYRQAYLRVMGKVMMIIVPAVVMMMVSADWLVMVLLGPQWSAAAGIFSVLGLVALTQPIGNATGWLFITQDRSREMFFWGLLSSGITVGSFAIGLPWGAFGVAAAYALVGLLIRTPLLFWYVGRKGAVTTRDFYRLFWPGAPCGLFVLAGLLLVRQGFPTLSPAAGVVISVLSSVVIALVTYYSIPSGRREMQDLRTLVALARREPAVA